MGGADPVLMSDTVPAVRPERIGAGKESLHPWVEYTTTTGSVCGPMAGQPRRHRLALGLANLPPRGRSGLRERGSGGGGMLAASLVPLLGRVLVAAFLTGRPGEPVGGPAVVVDSRRGTR